MIDTILQRFTNLESFLDRNRIDALLVTHPPNIRYFTGFSGEEGIFLFIPPEKFLFVDARYTLRAKAECSETTVTEVARPIEATIQHLKDKNCSRVGLETAHLTVDQFRRIGKLLKGLRIKSLKDKLDTLRMVKDASEIQSIEQAIDIHTKALNETLAWVTPDMTEREWAVEFEYRAKRHGASALSFDTIVASGPRSAIPHATADPVPLHDNSPIVFDHGVVFQGYCSDETATFFPHPPGKTFQKIYQIVTAAPDKALAAVHPGMKASAIDAVAREYIESAGYGKAFTHGTGHGVGLEIHERPTIGPRDSTRLQPGMVFTIEPGIYIAGKGGVRIEDMILVTGDGSRVLTKRAKSLTVIFEK